MSKGGMPARYGGEEFAVVFQSLSKEDAAITTEIIRDKVAKQPLLIRGNGSDSESEENVTVSVGVAESLQQWWTQEKIEDLTALPEEEKDTILCS